jgi:hypothetical protein
MGTKVVTKTQNYSKISVLPFGYQRILNYISRESAKVREKEEKSKKLRQVLCFRYTY